MTQQPRVPDDWYEHFFTVPVNRFWEKMVPAEVTAADLAFIRRHIEVQPPARMLDIPCGAGRHALALAAEGYDVVGVDLSEDAIARAAALARDRAMSARFVRADMRRFDDIGRFDAAICLGNSIGYFGAAGAAKFLARLAASLVPGARLILDSSVCAESILPLPADREIAFEGGSYRSALSYDCARSVLETQAELTLDGETHALAYAHHIVTSGALVAMLSEAGFEVEGMFADTEDAPFRVGSPRLLLVARRR
jgi:cyclopropane fatty-acyl-phospholipid synthase-like methyltransferase